MLNQFFFYLEYSLHKLRKKSEQEMANDAIKKVEKMSF